MKQSCVLILLCILIPNLDTKLKGAIISLILNIIFTNPYKNEFEKKFQIAESHVRNIINNPFKISTVSEDGLTISIYLSQLIDKKFYILVWTEIQGNNLQVKSAFKLLKGFVEEEHVNDPKWILQKFVNEFGLVIQVGEQVGKFIYKEDILVKPSLTPTNLLTFNNFQNHAFFGSQYFKIIESPGHKVVKCFLIFFIDVDRYLSWIDDKSNSDNEEAAKILKEKLKSCPVGKPGWREYEGICKEIVEFLFRDDFYNFNAEEQLSTYDGLEIRDLLVVNDAKPESLFWSGVKNEFGSNQIIYEFKNLTDEIGKDEVYQTDDYTNKAIGFFAIIFSRKGLSPNGVSAVKRKYDSTDKVLVLNCTDEDLIEMLTLRSAGKDPTIILQQKKTEFESTY